VAEIYTKKINVDFPKEPRKVDFYKKVGPFCISAPVLSRYYRAVEFSQSTLMFPDAHRNMHESYVFDDLAAL
jgi:hypothetical protein